MPNRIQKSLFIAHAETIVPLSDSFKSNLLSKLRLLKVKKGACILKQGTLSEYVYFIRQGYVRGYYEYQDKEITLWLNSVGEVVGSGSPIIGDVPANETIEAIEDCELELIKKADIRKMLQTYYEVLILMNHLLMNYYTDASERALMSKIPNASDRYKYFLKSRYGKLANEVHLKYIASFLGIRNETLSRIRASIK